MNCRRRYALVTVGLLAVMLLLLAAFHPRTPTDPEPTVLEYFSDVVESYTFDDNDENFMKSSPRRQSTSECRMSNCFDFKRCISGDFRVYVYPSAVGGRVSANYNQILRALRSSRYYTNDPHTACIFVLAIDTLDRDKLSSEYVLNIQNQIEALPWWNGGLNHVIFNLYSGTWPDYNENGLGFDIGRAMLAKASISEIHYRPEFDVSFPLFHKEHAYLGGEPGAVTTNNVPPTRRYILTFKGKRYLTGIGSETRNSLYHIHNGVDIILLTTCKHGKGWKTMEDVRCEKDNLEYDKWDYKVLLRNSTFCLVPRGRRLGSYRFLESLQAGCVPVLLSNNWVLPFSEVIDWSRAVVWGDERLLLQIPNIVRSVAHSDVLAMRQQTQFLWDTYFSSIEKIVGTTLEIIKERVDRFIPRTSFVWNTVPGAMAVCPEYSQSPSSYPFYWRTLNYELDDTYTAVIYATNASLGGGTSSTPLQRLLKVLAKTSNLNKILILWRIKEPLPIDNYWLPVNYKVPLIHKRIQSVDQRFTPYPEITTHAVLGLDEDVTIITDEIDFAFNTWRQFPDRIVGYPVRNHFWDDGRQKWSYTSKRLNDYSMVLTSAAFYHRYYGYIYTTTLPPSLHQIVDKLQMCDDILFNFLVAHITKFPPIKVAQRRTFKDPTVFPSSISSFSSDNSTNSHPPTSFSSSFSSRRFCINRFAEEFGYMALQRSALRLDPLFFKDPVAIFRKKYRLIDTVA